MTGTHPATIIFRVRIRPSDKVASLLTWHQVMFRFGDAPVRDQAAGVEFNLDLVAR